MSSNCRQVYTLSAFKTSKWNASCNIQENSDNLLSNEIVAAPTFSTVAYLTRKWNEKANNFISKQKSNPFSGRYKESERKRWIKGTPEYAQPVGKTAERRIKALSHVSKEMHILCDVIEMMGEPDRYGNVHVTFGELFERYNRISNKVVGTLIRARRHNLVDFKGEMLWQGRDNHVTITRIYQYE